MRRLAGMLFLVILFTGARAQPYGNEWIDYNQTYYKIPLTGEGIYRISYSALVGCGDLLNGHNPQNIQIFIKGREWPIYIYGEGDGIFHPSDYIEFYAPPSDGWLDSLMFSPASSISNPYYSMYNDTLYAFLTANYSWDNLRATYETDVNFSAYSSFLSPWCIKRLIWQNPLLYYAGVSDPLYAGGEGWFDSEYFQMGTSVPKLLSTPGFAGTVYPVSLEYSIAGASNGSSSYSNNHHLKVSVNGLALSDTMFSGYNTVKSTLPLNQPLTAYTTVTAESVDDLYASADRMTICYLALTYPRLYSFSSLSKALFTVPSTGGTKTLLNISGMTSSDVVLWDITNNRKILCQANSGVDYALLPDNGQNRLCYVSTVASVKNAVINGSFQPIDYSSIASNSNYYIITHPSLTSSATQYKYHRDDTGLNAVVIDIEQLYCQFAYGIYKHPLSVRNFIRYALDSFAVKPEYLFLLGKSIHAGRWSYNECFRRDAANYSRCLVPSWGSPSSDNMLVAGINGTANEMPLAVGRLSATSDSDVIAYLNKVTQHEQQQPAMWMKNVLHFSGGQTAWEQSLFASYLDSYRVIVEDTLFGGQVTTIYKTSSIPVQITISDSIRNIINGGCSMMNFFGHGSSTGFDQNIEQPSYYNNTWKYPLLIANSCLTGDIHLPPPLRLSETWVLTPSKGAIAFLANVDLGYSDRLNVFTSEFIKQFTYKKYGESLGKQVQSTINQIVSDYNLNQQYINTAIDYTLHGDPAVILNSFPEPDLMVDNSSVYFSPNPVTTSEDTFNVNVIVYNQGMAISDTFLVELTRTFPDGNTATFYKTMYGCVNRDTVAFHLSPDVVSGAGPNHFCVRADPEDSIAEKNEFNNQVCIDIIIQSGDLIPVHPYEYAIYPASTVKLKASSSYAFANPQQCVFQIDTDDEFEPSHLAEGLFTYPGGVAEWQPPFALQDCTVYYWRVSIVGDTLNWKESSFIYIPGKTGWSQAHYFQFKKDGYRFIDYDRPGLDWDFQTSPHLLKCHTMGSSAITIYEDYKYSIDATGDYSSCGPVNAILVVVIDPETLVPWKSNRFPLGFGGHVNDPSCRPRPDLYYVFYANDTYLPALENFISNIIPDGYYILVYTFINGMFQTWDTSLYEAFESLGDTIVRNLPDDHPYVFFCKKGDPSTAKMMWGQSSFEVLDFEHEILTDNDYGYMTSTLIGPSANWGSLHWRYLADYTDETARLKVTGITLGGDTQVIFPSLSRDTLDIYDLEQHIQASTHPYMEMNLYTKDDSLESPVWMQRWQVTYDGVPETAINPSKGYIPPKDTLEEGDTLIFGVATENISEFYMDSLLVRYWLTDRNNQIVPLDVRRLRPHPGSHVLMDSIHVSTSGYPGFNSIWYEVNTTNSATGHYDQLEQYHFNNYAQKTFYVRSDIINPLLDVTFDGVRILNGDIVSAKPFIVIGLKDENKFIAPVREEKDTVVFQVYIKNLQTGIENRIYFGDQSIMKFVPATLPKNSCKIEYSPSFPEDGKYQLRVQARDLSGNESGDYDYTIQFEVINKSTITNIFNYPNPFSTSTRFVFTLTGSELPEDMRIQIITVTGKVVREITQAELGPVHVGNNVTEFAWDGTDMYGDKLANGVYFYRVIAKLGGGSIEHRETDADNLFHKGFGKMYLIR